jgi:hypothetical protein
MDNETHGLKPNLLDVDDSIGKALRQQPLSNRNCSTFFYSNTRVNIANKEDGQGDPGIKTYS